MIPIWWSVLLTVVGVTGLWVAGRKSAWGWAIGLAAQVLWIAYAVATYQWGFIASALCYGVVYARNAWHWWRPTDTASIAGKVIVTYCECTRGEPCDRPVSDQVGYGGSGT